jgi:ureidoglycolate lyase
VNLGQVHRATASREALAKEADMTKEIALKPAPINAAGFAPFGQVIAPAEDGNPFGPNDAQLVLTNGTPRLYIMRLHERGLRAERITRHCRVTQCLAAMGGKAWLIAVAPPVAPDDLAAMPDPATIRAFRIPGTLAIKLHRGTWHAGPFFTEPTIDFLNLELSDTNETDHVNCYLARDLGITLRFEV